jgi:LmbE family N-acetylglucosaminyl deacetylase
LWRGKHMSNPALTPGREQARSTVLVVAAHPDDEVLGCGGTLARMAGEGSKVHVLLMADGETSRETPLAEAAQHAKIAARNAACEAARAILGYSTVEAVGLPDQRLDSFDLLDVVRRVETVIQRLQPVTLLTHHAGDANADHRVVHDAVVAACRPQPGHPVKELLFYEVPSSTEWRPACSAQPFNPNWFVDISSTLSTKMRALQAYGEELRAFPHPRSVEAVEALAKWRGASIGVRAAEAFMLGRSLR